MEFHEKKNRIFSFRLLYHIVLLFACYGTWVQHLSIIITQYYLYNRGKYKIIHTTKNLIHFVKLVKSETNYRNEVLDYIISCMNGLSKSEIKMKTRQKFKQDYIVMQTFCR